MKKRKITIFVVGVLLVITALLTVIHLTTRQEATAGAIQVVCPEGVAVIPVADLSPVPITGTMVNGKGEERAVNGEGVSVACLLKRAGVEVTGVTVTASDEYAVSLTAEEVAAENKAWLLLEEDSIRLIVFGDEDSRRNVKNVVRVTPE